MSFKDDISAERIEKRRIDWLFAQSESAYLAAFVLSTIFLVLSWSAWPRHTLIGWYLSVQLVNLCRFLVYRSWKRLDASTAEVALPKYRALFLGGTLLSGLTWGVLGWMFNPEGPREGHLLVALVTSGMSAAAVASYSVWTLALHGYLVIMLAPLYLSLTFSPTMPMRLCAPLVVIFALMMARLGHQLRLWFTRDSALAEQNERLLATVQEKHKELLWANDELIDYQIELTRVTEAKSEFLATLTHEIRTPMNGILGMSDFLARRMMGAEEREAISTLRSCGDLLLHLLNNVLDFSKIEAGQMEFERCPFDLRKCLQDTLSILAPLAAKKDIALSLRFVNALPPVVIGDMSKLQQVILNLSNNALKFTEKGSVTVVAELTEQFGSECVIHVAVEDTGMGISDDQMKRLFKKFTQADASTTRRFGGTGLGLAICKAMVELMGGSIWVESKAGEGSQFHFNLRLTESDGAAAVNLAHEPEWPLAQELPLRILIAEDEPVNRLITLRLLKEMGYVAASLPCVGCRRE